MKNPPTVLIAGAGAVGGFFGWKLSSVANICFLARRDSAAAIRKNGFSIQSENEKHTFKPAVLESVSPFLDVELCLLAVKFTGLAETLQVLEPLRDKNTVFVSLLNGIEHHHLVAEYFGEQRVIKGFCQLGAEKTGPGEVLHRSLGNVFCGKFPQTSPLAFEKTIALFSGAGVKISEPADFDRALWLKFAWNAVFNTLCAFFNATTDVIIDTPEYRFQADRLFDEVLHAARLENVALYESDRAGVIDGTRKWGAFIPSTLQDLRKKAPLETDAFRGAMLRLAAKHNSSFPAFTFFDVTN